MGGLRDQTAIKIREPFGRRKQERFGINAFWLFVRPFSGVIGQVEHILQTEVSYLEKRKFMAQ